MTDTSTITVERDGQVWDMPADMDPGTYTLLRVPDGHGTVLVFPWTGGGA